MIKKNKKAIMGMFIVFVFFAVILIFLFSFGIPILINFNADFYDAGNDILASINTSNLSNVSIDAINAAKNSTPQQISILSFFFQYSWVIILIIILLVIYIRSRSLVEVKIR